MNEAIERDYDAAVEARLSRWERVQRLRKRTFARMGLRCFFCGVEGSEREMTVDHLTPRSRGGTDEDDNVVPACKPCNAAKGSRTLEEYGAGRPRLKESGRNR